jgi:hypothetical protein
MSIIHWSTYVDLIVHIFVVFENVIREWKVVCIVIFLNKQIFNQRINSFDYYWSNHSSDSMCSNQRRSTLLERYCRRNFMTLVDQIKTLKTRAIYLSIIVRILHVICKCIDMMCFVYIRINFVVQFIKRQIIDSFDVRIVDDLDVQEISL